MSDGCCFDVIPAGRFGVPAFSASVFLGMLAAIVSSIVESVGDYYATARVCGLPAPAKHAMNRGVMMEGVASVLSGLFGVGHATTSYSGTVGTIQITSVSTFKLRQDF
jgi:nucleobase transporter 1/2